MGFGNTKRMLAKKASRGIHSHNLSNPASSAQFQDGLDNDSRRALGDVLASVIISQKTSILSGTIAHLLGHDSVECSRVSLLVPSKLEYNSGNETFDLSDHPFNLSSDLGIFFNLEGCNIRAVIRLLSLTDSYKGEIISYCQALLLTS